MNDMVKAFRGLAAMGTVAAMLLVACGGSAPAASEAPDAATGPEAPASTEVSAMARSETGGLGQIMEKAQSGEIVSVVIDDCSWGLPEGGGTDGLNLTFSVINNSKKIAWTTFRVMNGSGAMYRPGGTGSELTVQIGETGSETIHTDKFDLGAGDLKLIVSSRQLGEQHRVVKEEVPLDNCTQP